MFKILLATWVTFVITLALSEIGRPVTCVATKIVSYNLPLNVAFFLFTTIFITWLAFDETSKK